MKAASSPKAVNSEIQGEQKSRAKPFRASLRSQASLFDGLTFLMIVSFSMALVFTYLNTYGTSEDSALRSAHTMNYMQAMMKSFYFIDLATLANVTDEGLVSPHPYLDLGANCSKLIRWRGTFSVAEMIKKDLADENPASNTGCSADVPQNCGVPCFDDSFGYGDTCKTNPGSGAFAPGKLAMRCAMKEIMKPFSYAGYRYLVDIVDDSGITLGRKLTYPWPKITNSLLPSQNQTDVPIIDCEDVVDSLRALNKTPEVFAVSAPFRVLQNTGGTPVPRKFTIRTCIWQE